MLAVGPQWMETMRIPVLRGRGLTEADDNSGEPVALVNERFVRVNFPNEDPIGEFNRNPIGVTFDFEEIVERHRAGEPEAVLLHPRSGETAALMSTNDK